MYAEVRSGFSIAKPQVIFKLEQGKGPCIYNLQRTRETYVLKVISSDRVNHLEIQETISEFEIVHVLEKQLEMKTENSEEETWENSLSPEREFKQVSIVSQPNPTQESGCEDSECGKAFFDDPFLTQYQIIHTAEKPFECPDIRVVQVSEDHLEIKRESSEEEAWENPLSPERDFKQVSIISQQNPTQERGCEYNEHGKTFFDDTSLTHYQIIHTAQKSYECPPFEVVNVPENQLEIKKESSEEETWENSLSPENDFKQVSIITQQNPTPEKDCDYNEHGKTFFNDPSLNQYQIIHTEEKPYESQKAFNSSSATLNQTVRNGEGPYECYECGKVFRWKCNLTRHQQTHSGEKAYDSGKAVFDQSSLTEHQKTHKEEKHSKSNEFRKALSKQSSVTEHERTPAAEKRHECDECGKTFTLKSSLNRHQRIHMGEKPYECDECGKPFSQKSNLQKHWLTHTGEKAYECNECGKAFTLKCNLTRHQLIHTGEKPYLCSLCGKVFSSKSSIIQHQRRYVKD